MIHVTGHRSHRWFRLQFAFIGLSQAIIPAYLVQVHGLGCPVGDGQNINLFLSSGNPYRMSAVVHQTVKIICKFFSICSSILQVLPFYQFRWSVRNQRVPGWIHMAGSVGRIILRSRRGDGWFSATATTLIILSLMAPGFDSEWSKPITAIIRIIRAWNERIKSTVEWHWFWNSC